MVDRKDTNTRAFSILEEALDRQGKPGQKQTAPKAPKEDANETAARTRKEATKG